MQKHVNLVDLIKSFQTNIYLQKLASIQPRTSPNTDMGYHWYSYLLSSAQCESCARIGHLRQFGAGRGSTVDQHCETEIAAQQTQLESSLRDVERARTSLRFVLILAGAWSYSRPAPIAVSLTDGRGAAKRYVV